jgi:hypothetical protein
VWPGAADSDSDSDSDDDGATTGVGGALRGSASKPGGDDDDGGVAAAMASLSLRASAAAADDDPVAAALATPFVRCPGQTPPLRVASSGPVTRDEVDADADPVLAALHGRPPVGGGRASTEMPTSATIVVAPSPSDSVAETPAMQRIAARSAAFSSVRRAALAHPPVPLPAVSFHAMIDDAAGGREAWVDIAERCGVEHEAAGRGVAAGKSASAAEAHDAPSTPHAPADDAAAASTVAAAAVLPAVATGTPAEPRLKPVRATAASRRPLRVRFADQGGGASGSVAEAAPCSAAVAADGLLAGRAATPRPRHYHRRSLVGDAYDGGDGGE